MDYNSLYLIFGSMLAVLAAGNPYIGLLKKRYFGQYIREDGPQSHHSKAGTPTAGGVLILGAMLVGLVVALLTQPKDYFTDEVWITVAVTLVFGALGFVDDYLKITKKHNKGVTGYTKLAVQLTVGLLVGLYVMSTTHMSDITLFNFGRVDLGWLYPIFAMFVITGTSNSVNLTDGLDGLAAGTCACSFLALAILFTNTGFADLAAVYPDLAMISLILLGATFGFLFFNANPARIFMGDTGSLALGGAIGTLGVLARVELWLFLLGGVFAMETISVLLQVASFKTTGKRIFKMSPIHHHFELCGWSEPQVVTSFVSLQFVLCAAAIFLYNRGL